MATNRNIPLSIDAALLAKIDSVAESLKENRSAVMRRAIREGLPLIEKGGGSDVLTFDSELSKDIDDVSKECRLSRAKVILESVRTGIQPFYNRLMREKIVHAQDRSSEAAEALLAGMEQIDQLDDPMSREMITALRQRGAALRRFYDLLQHVPDARRRFNLVERLTKI